MFSCLENLSKLQLLAKNLKKAIDTYRIFAKIASLSRRSRCEQYYDLIFSGISSVVEHNLAKVGVESSNLFARSSRDCQGNQ